MSGSDDLQPTRATSQRPLDRPSHPPLATALLLIGVMAVIIGMAAISTFG